MTEHMTGLQKAFLMEQFGLIPCHKIEKAKADEWLLRPELLVQTMIEVLNRGVPKPDPILRLLYPDEIITLAVCNGKRTIWKSPKTFPVHRDPDFKNWDLNKPDAATEETQVSVYELVKDATLKVMFKSLNPNLDALCLTQDQVIDFCEKNVDKLRKQGYAMFFLIKKDDSSLPEEDRFFVAYVRVFSDGLFVDVCRLEYAYVWRSSSARRLVVPQLKL